MQIGTRDGACITQPCVCREQGTQVYATNIQHSPSLCLPGYRSKHTRGGPSPSPTEREDTPRENKCQPPHQKRQQRKLDKTDEKETKSKTPTREICRHTRPRRSGSYVRRPKVNTIKRKARKKERTKDRERVRKAKTAVTCAPKAAPRGRPLVHVHPGNGHEPGRESHSRPTKQKSKRAFRAYPVRLVYRKSPFRNISRPISEKLLAKQRDY